MNNSKKNKFGRLNTKIAIVDSKAMTKIKGGRRLKLNKRLNTCGGIMPS